MKKIFIGLGIFGVYVIYSVGIRHIHPILAKPSSLANNSGGGSSANANTGATASGNSGAQAQTSSKYKDGTYTGSVADAYYGNVQVSVTITGGKITDVKFLQYPYTHSTSVFINKQAMPYLKQETIQAQSSNVQLISGATFTSQAFVQSLQSALSKA